MIVFFAKSVLSPLPLSLSLLHIEFMHTRLGFSFYVQLTARAGIRKIWRYGSRWGAVGPGVCRSGAERGLFGHCFVICEITGFAFNIILTLFA